MKGRNHITSPPSMEEFRMGAQRAKECRDHVM
jgi:hypothetical protein